jgi:hypothetical protein
MRDIHFPKWLNTIRVPALAGAGAGVIYVIAFVWIGFSPRATDVGYQPQQPVQFSHALHAGELGIDCRYCHNTVEVSSHAATPPTQTCMGCHSMIRTNSLKLEPLRTAFKTDKPLQWVKVHDLPDYVYFNHSAHVRRGVGCVSCHGRIDKMETVYQHEPLSMGWCLECHRNPENALRPKELITKMDYAPEGSQTTIGLKLKKDFHLNPSTDCSTCHR